MKKINLKGITNSLSDGEMKLVKGGIKEVQANFDDGGGGSGGTTASLKCYGTVHSCHLTTCPGSTADAQAKCMTAACGGEYGSNITCTYS